MLLLRLVVGVGLALQASALFRGAVSSADAAVDLAAGLGGILVLVGLWTPVIGLLVALVEFSAAYVWHSKDPWTYLLLGALGISLALLGPGAYSIDARLFGWKRIEIPDRKS